MDYIGLAIRLKQQMNDIIDVAYRDKSASVRGQLKRFSIHCTDKTLKTSLADCQWNAENRTSFIRIFALADEGYKEILITAMHEVSHHIDFSFREESWHDAPFYLAHKKLLFAAFDMGILCVTDVTHGNSHGRDKNKLAKMMKEYSPHPVKYKQEVVQIFVYNAFAAKDMLKARGYQWNGLEIAWTRELQAKDVDDEKMWLALRDIAEDDIKVVEGSAVIVRLRKNVRLYYVPYDKKDVVKKYGYRWHGDGKVKYWWKKIDGDSLQEDERVVLTGIPGIQIVIT